MRSRRIISMMRLWLCPCGERNDEQADCCACCGNSYICGELLLDKLLPAEPLHAAFIVGFWVVVATLLCAILIMALYPTNLAW